jgi:hypothetical protein
MISRFVAATSTQQRRLADLINNPVLQEFAPIDPNAAVMIAFEATAAGMRLLCETVEKEERKRDREPLQMRRRPWTDEERVWKSCAGHERFAHSSGWGPTTNPSF